MVEPKKFLQVLRKEKTENVPFWFMRQAGRYLPEYRALRQKKQGFLSMVMDPDAACEITLQPVRRFGMDAAILFSDILVVPMALGQRLEFVEGEGPKLDPVRIREQIAALDYSNFRHVLSPIYQTIRNVRAGLLRENFSGTALIGFAGSPWTVAAYMIEGGGSKDFFHARRMAYAQPDDFAALIDKVVAATIDYLDLQVEAGAEALQLFDSWSGLADADQFQRWVIEPTRKIIEQIHVKHPHIPVIGFPRGAGIHYTAYVEQAGIQGVGVDSQISTCWAAEHLQKNIPVQGNLDPLCLLAGGKILEDTIDRILRDLAGGDFIFNLGHGIHKDTPIPHVELMVEKIKTFRR